MATCETLPMPEPAIDPHRAAEPEPASARRVCRALVSICTYNEIENLPRLVEEVECAAPTVDVLVVDDNSPDGTGRWCSQRAAEDARLTCISRSGKLGLGTAIVAAMRAAIQGDYDYLINMDADFSHDPAAIPRLLELAEGPARPDLVIGSRYSPGGRIEGWPWTRHAMSRAVNASARLLLGLRVGDCSGGFRCYRVEALRRVPLDELASRGYAIQEEVLWQLVRHGAQVVETPITFVDRRLGSSKISSREAVEAGWRMLRLAGRRLRG